MLVSLLCYVGFLLSLLLIDLSMFLFLFMCEESSFVSVLPGRINFQNTYEFNWRNSFKNGEVIEEEEDLLKRLKQSKEIDKEIYIWCFTYPLMTLSIQYDIRRTSKDNYPFVIVTKLSSIVITVKHQVKPPYETFSH